jgi:uncharacterized protein YdhG (YjbR/CyaY superfamily)
MAEKKTREELLIEGSLAVENYIHNQPNYIQPRLMAVREFICNLVPEDTLEFLSYGMPAYKYKGMLVGFMAAKKHVGFYTWNGHTVADFATELKGFVTTKSGIQLPLDKPLPEALLKKIIQTRIADNEAKQAAKNKVAKTSKKADKKTAKKKG